jgi:hypothetical protein
MTTPGLGGEMRKNTDEPHVLAQPVKALPVESYSDFAGKAEAGPALWRS